ncbi:hypothetical protein DFH08DRAFT_820779 [Mycena albidolilacea]|uniref:Uncharacterized protein n=1 Tax=Mycena albidolilacea TaxID=1033008 RepID=A0AAD6ZCG4_9AGAR|nr:hypothetical protein DFH08DRAFT_820779 [Mycena albidolilacea]
MAQLNPIQGSGAIFQQSENAGPTVGIQRRANGTSLAMIGCEDSHRGRYTESCRALTRKTRTTERVITAVGGVTRPVTVPYSLGRGLPTDGFHPYTGYGPVATARESVGYGYGLEPYFITGPRPEARVPAGGVLGFPRLEKEGCNINARQTLHSTLGRAARRARRAGSTGSGDGHTVPFRGLFHYIFDGRSRRKRPSTGRRVLKTRYKRLNMPCMPFEKHVLCKGPVEMTAVPVTGTACSPNPRVDDGVLRGLASA